MTEVNKVLELLDRYDSLAAAGIASHGSEAGNLILKELREEKEKLKQELSSGKSAAKKVLIDRAYSHGRYTVAMCPTCGDVLGLLSFAQNYKHCHRCDQLLDWSDVK